MENYSRVRKDASEITPPAENEVRVMSNGKLRHYVDVAISLLEEKKLPHIFIKAMGRAINKTVAIAEIVKRRIPGLHQQTELGSVSISDTFEPKVEGLSPLVVSRNVSAITVHLSTGTQALDTSHPGYQPPLPADQVVPIGEEELQEMETSDATASRGRGRGRGRGGRRGGRGRGRGGRGANNGDAGDGLAELGDAEGGVTNGDGPLRGGRRGRGGRGRGRGRGRGGRGRGRGEGGDGAAPE